MGSDFRIPTPTFLGAPHWQLYPRGLWDRRGKGMQAPQAQISDPQGF